MLKGKVLHVGCGGADLPDWCGKCDEVKLDIDPLCNPDIVADIRDMGSIGEFDIVFSAHVIEHFYAHEIQIVFNEFKRVLKTGGVAIMFVPNLENVKPTEDVLYVSAGGIPVTGLDMIYGMSVAIKDSPYMAHHTGFTKARLEKELLLAGFIDVMVSTDYPYSLMGIGKKGE